MIRPQLDRVVIDPAVRKTAVAASVRRNAGGAEIVEAATDDYTKPVVHLSRREGKRLLLVRQFRGSAFKPCQGRKPEYACCGLHTLNESNNCALECSYCILQAYLSDPHLSVFANVAELQDEVARGVAAEPHRLFRVTTGELADSLTLDPLTEMSRHWVPFFRDLPNAVLELKTKSNNIENLLDLDHGEKTVVSWSVNPPQVVMQEELKTAGLEERLAAAQTVAERGYPVGFHLDPIVQCQDWREAYAALLERLVEAVAPSRWAWISLGTLRYLPEMRNTAGSRFPRSRLPGGDLVRGEDGKLRYLRPLRIQIYRWILENLRRHGACQEDGPAVYLCMEPAHVWGRVFDGWTPTPTEIDHHLASRYRSRFARGNLPTMP